MSWTNTAKNTSVFGAQEREGVAAFITTDAPDYVLLGSAETEYLVWRDESIFTNQIKS